MQVPDYTFRPLSTGDTLRDNEVEVSASQKDRIEGILREKEAMRAREARDINLAMRPHRSKGSRKRR